MKVKKIIFDLFGIYIPESQEGKCIHLNKDCLGNNKYGYLWKCRTCGHLFIFNPMG